MFHFFFRFLKLKIQLTLVIPNTDIKVSSDIKDLNFAHLFFFTDQPLLSQTTGISQENFKTKSTTRYRYFVINCFKTAKVDFIGSSR